MAGLHGLVAEAVQGVAGELAKAVEEARGLQQQLRSTASAAVERLLMARERRLWREEVMRLEEEVAEWERLGDERQQ